MQPGISRVQCIRLNLFHILIDGLFDVMPVILAFMALYFGSGEKTVGVVISCGAAASTVTGLSTAFFSRKFGFSGTVSLLTAVSGICFAGAAFAGNIVFAGACFVPAVAGYAVFHNIAFSYITRNTERVRLGRVMSDFTAIGDIGRIPLVSFAAFAAAYPFMGFPGWRAVCLAYGGIALFAALWLFLSSRRGKTNGMTQSAASGARTPVRALLRNRDLFLSLSASVLNAFSNDRIFTFLPLLLVAKGLEPGIIGSFALGFTVGSFLGKMACGRFVDRFGARRVFILAQLVLAAFLCLMITVNALAVILAIALLLGIVTKGTVPVIQAIITEPVRGAASYDAVFSANSFARGVTNMLTPLLFGFTASAAGMGVVYALMAATALLAVPPVLFMAKPGSR